VISERSFPHSFDAVTQARHFAVEALQGIDAEAREAIAVMVSELATNAVRYAETPFSVRIITEAAVVRIEITDRGPGLPRLQHPAPTELSGRGLRIVESLADSWGIDQDPARPGKTVWFEVNRDDGATASARSGGTQVRRRV
jgi:anti-sigma regulatory factor (Ser/Thr protein kinase)